MKFPAMNYVILLF